MANFTVCYKDTHEERTVFQIQNDKNGFLNF